MRMYISNVWRFNNGTKIKPLFTARKTISIIILLETQCIICSHDIIDRELTIQYILEGHCIPHNGDTAIGEHIRYCLCMYKRIKIGIVIGTM